MKALMLIVALCAGLGLAACGSDDSTGATGAAETTAESSDSADGSDSGTATDDSDSAADDSDSAGGKGPKPTIEVPEGPPPTELVVKDIEVGDGDEIKEGDKISVAYVGVFYKDGKELESTWAGTAPEEFEKGGGILIDGWEQGLEGMRVGGRRELIIPSELAFNRGDLIYVVDLLGIK